MHIRTLAAIPSLIPAVLMAQTFTQIAPLPTQSDLWGVSFTSANNGFIAGDGHTFFKTTNGGNTWMKILLPGYEDGPFYNVTFATPTLGFVSGNSAVGSKDIFRTIDGGATWDQVQSFPLGGSWYHQDYLDAMTGFMGANGALVRTQDGGETWLLRSGYPDCPVIFGMDFIDENTGLVGGLIAGSSDEGIFKTTNGGQTWRLKHPRVANDVAYLSDTVAVADEGVNIVRTHDGGETWFQTGAYIETGLGDIEALDANTLVGVSFGGDIWRSGDGGYTWSHRWIGEGDLPAQWSVSFRDNLNGHVVGQAGAILATSDGGITWSRVNRGISKDWNGMAAFSDSRIVLAGHHGYVQMTTDRGSHWTPQLLDPPTFGRDTSFSDIQVIDSNTAVAVGHWGGLFKSTDRGESWINLSYTQSPDYYGNGLEFVDANNGWMVGWDYTWGADMHTWRTRDGGLSWEPAPQINIPGIDVEFLGQRGWLLTSGQPLWRTQNGGESWTMSHLATNGGSAPSPSQMAWGNASVGYVCGWDGYIAKSVNGGASWVQLGAMQEGLTYLGVLAIGSNEVWVCGARAGGGGAVVKRSVDGGGTWRTWNLPGQYTTPYQMIKTPSYLYVSGYNGAVWRMPLGTRTQRVPG